MTSQRTPGPAVMDQDQVWQMINTQRLKVASLLEQLTPGEWRQLAKAHKSAARSTPSS